MSHLNVFRFMRILRGAGSKGGRAGGMRSRTRGPREDTDVLGADAAADLADNTLDMMVSRELKGDDFMSVNEMRDELYQCTSSTTILARPFDNKSSLCVP